MYCWGDGSSGQLGVHLRSNEIVISIPKVVNMHRERISKIACGEKHTMFLTANGTILTCGRNSKGQLGRTKNNGATLPVAVKGLPAIVGVACGREHCLALCESGQVFSWGRGSEGQLGGGEILTKVAKPRKVVIPSPMQIPVVQIACGNHHSLALTKGGEVFAWGQNSHGQLGLGKSVLCQKIPAPVHYLTGVPVAQICAGGAYSLALSLSGQVYCCGANDKGQLGLNRVDEKGRFVVLAVPALRLLRVSSMSCGEAHTAVITKDGEVFTFGEGSCGQLGHNSTADELKPRKVESIDGEAAQIACGSRHTLVLMSSGQLLAFGSGLKGQLGNGSVDNCSQPSLVQQAWRSAGPLSTSGMKIFSGWNTSFIRTKPAESFIGRETIFKMEEEKLQIWGTLNAGRDDIAEAQREVNLMFSSNSSLVASFTRNSDSASLPTARSLSVDLHAVRKTFKQIQEIPWIKTSISTGPLMETLCEAAPFMKSVEIFLILPEWHQLHDDNVIGIIQPFAKAIVNLSDSSMKLLSELWSNLEPDVVKKHIHMWKRALAFLLNSLGRFNSSLKDVLLVLKRLYKANKKARNSVPIDEFYNQFHRHFLQEDVTLWLFGRNLEDKEEAPAILCRFPFVLNLQSKIIVFNIVANWLKALQPILMLGMKPLEAPPELLFRLRLKHNALLEDTFRQLSMADYENFRKELVVDFVDDLKPTLLNVRDFFLHIFKQLFAPDSDMFMYDDSNTLAWFPVKPVHPEKRYFLLGVLCGMALYNNNRVDLPFPLALFKKLLNVKPTLEDLEELSPVLGTSLRHTLDYSDEVIKKADMYFSVYWNGVEVALDPTEEEKVVTGANKKDFVNASVDYILNKSVEKVFEEFKRGFFKVCDADVMTLFQPEELMGVMLGSEAYNWEVLKQNTVYEGEYHAKHPNIVMFWEVFEEMLEDQKKAFLLFLTGFKRVPILGMDTIRMRVAVLANSSREHYPESLTCHFLLLLPIYQSRKLLRARLIEALNHNTGFWKD